MKLGKELYRKTHELYSQWNQVELVDNLRNAENFRRSKRGGNMSIFGSSA